VVGPACEIFRTPVKDLGPSSLGALLGVFGLALVVVEVRGRWHRPSGSIDEQGEPRRSFDLTQQGFTLLVMAGPASAGGRSLQGCGPGRIIVSEPG
jgi:hypothetical protein